LGVGWRPGGVDRDCKGEQLSASEQLVERELASLALEL
jgi:hypothetical protein